MAHSSKFGGRKRPNAVSFRAQAKRSLPIAGMIRIFALVVLDGTLQSGDAVILTGLSHSVREEPLVIFGRQS